MSDRVQRQERSYGGGKTNKTGTGDVADTSDSSDAESERAEDDPSSSTTMIPSQAPASTSRPPPPRPNQVDELDLTSETQQPPQSAQRIQMPQMTSTVPGDTQESAAGDGQAYHNFEATTTDDIAEDEQMLDKPSLSDQLVEDQSPNDPNEAIADFDWSNLKERYRQKMLELDREEKKVYQEFDDLVLYFDAWMTAIDDREKTIGDSRLSAQIRYVLKEEVDLEEKREHYNKVVEAFKTIARVLYGPETASAPGSVTATTAKHSPSESLQHDRFFARFLETKRSSPSTVVAKPPALVKSAPQAYSDIHSARCVVS